MVRMIALSFDGAVRYHGLIWNTRTPKNGGRHLDEPVCQLRSPSPEGDLEFCKPRSLD
jgi:hypothetical protein